MCQAWPENTKVRDELARCVLLLCDASIEQRRIAAARALLNQYSIVTGADHPDRPWWWSSSEGYSRTLLARAKRIETLADQVVSRNDELSMSIQVRLVEQLADQKREYSLLKHWYDELLAAYQTLQRKRSLKP